MGVLSLALVLLGLNLGTIAGPSESSAAGTIEATSRSGLLYSTEATWGTALSNPDTLSSADSAHVLTGATIGFEGIFWRSARSLVYSLGSTPGTTCRIGYTRGLAQAAHEALEARTSVQLLVIISWERASNVLVLVVIPDLIVRTRGVLLAVRVLTIWIGVLDV